MRPTIVDALRCAILAQCITWYAILSKRLLVAQASCIIEVNNITFDDCDLLNLVCGENAVFVEGECHCRDEYVSSIPDQLNCIHVNETSIPTTSPTIGQTSTPSTSPTKLLTPLPTVQPSVSPTATRFQFRASPWSECMAVELSQSQECGVSLGTQSRIVECFDSLLGVTLPLHHKCSLVQQSLSFVNAPTSTRHCLVDTCSPSSPIIPTGTWMFPLESQEEGFTEDGAYGDCSKQCGGGIQERTLPLCVVWEENSGFTQVEVSLCDSRLKPTTSRTCNNFACTSPKLTPQSSESSCRGTCTQDGSTKVLINTCRDSTLGLPLPPSSCSTLRTVGETQKTTCTPNHCNSLVATGPTWNTGAWGTCSTTCGVGLKSRKVQCIDSVTRVPMSSAACLELSTQPATISSCNTLRECVRYIWVTVQDPICVQQCAANKVSLAENQGLLLECWDAISGEYVARNNCPQDAVLVSTTNAVCPRACSGQRRLLSHFVTIRASSNTQSMENRIQTTMSNDVENKAELFAMNISGKDKEREMRQRLSLLNHNKFDSLLDTTMPQQRSLLLESTAFSLESCPSGMWSTSGICCQVGSTTDREGNCCNQYVDKCGKCVAEPNESVVDVSGACCESGVLDASGICCTTSRIDRCGVCEGDNLSCGTSITVQLTKLNETIISSFADLGVQETIRMDSYSTQLNQLHDRLGNSLQFHSLESVTVQDTHTNAIWTSKTVATPKRDTVTEVILSELSELLSTLWFESDNYNLWYYQVTDWETVGVCGNNVCEFGEMCTSELLQAGNCCPSDCPVQFLTCPFDDETKRYCGGHGTCNHATGNCVCYPNSGREGISCSECKSEYTLVQTTSCVSSSIVEPNQTSSPVANCTNGVLDGDETSIDCGGSICEQCSFSLLWWVWVLVGVGSLIVVILLVWFMYHRYKIHHNKRGARRYRHHKGARAKQKEQHLSGIESVGSTSPTNSWFGSPKSRAVVVHASTEQRQVVNQTAHQSDPHSTSEYNTKGLSPFASIDDVVGDVELKTSEITTTSETIAQRRQSGTKFFNIFNSVRKKGHAKTQSLSEYAISTYVPSTTMFGHKDEDKLNGNDLDSLDSSHSQDGESSFLTHALARDNAFEGWSKLRCPFGSSNTSGNCVGVTGLNKRYQELYCVLVNHDKELQYYANMVPSKYGSVYVGLKGSIPLSQICKVVQSDTTTSKSEGKKVTMWLSKDGNIVNEVSHEIRILLDSKLECDQWYVLLRHYFRKNQIQHLKVGGKAESDKQNPNKLRRFSSLVHETDEHNVNQNKMGKLRNNGPRSAPHRSRQGKHIQAFFPDDEDSDELLGSGATHAIRKVNARRPPLPKSKPPQDVDVDEVFASDVKINFVKDEHFDSNTKGVPPPLPPLDYKVADDILHSSDLCIELNSDRESDCDSSVCESYDAPPLPAFTEADLSSESTEDWYAMGDTSLPPMPMDSGYSRSNAFGAAARVGWIRAKQQLRHKNNASTTTTPRNLEVVGMNRFRNNKQYVDSERNQDFQSLNRATKHHTSMAARVAVMAVRQHRLASNGVRKDTHSDNNEFHMKKTSAKSKSPPPVPSRGYRTSKTPATQQVQQANDIWDQFQNGIGR